MDFSDALRHLRAGSKIARAGWNGNGMWLAYNPMEEISSDQFASSANKAFAVQNGGYAIMLPFITMKTADNCIVPWLASQTDILADDWRLL